MVLLAIPVSLYTGSRDPYIQTFLARSAAGYLSKKMHTKITIAAFYFNLDLSLTLKKVVVHDLRDKELASIGYLRLKLNDYKIHKHLNVKQLELENVSFNLVYYEHEPDMNLQFLIDFFQPTLNANDSILYVADTISGIYPVLVDRLKITDGAFRYWDQDYDFPGEPGMDYGHLNIQDIQLDARNISMFGDSIIGNIKHLSARDTCGLILKHLSADAIVSGTTTIANHFVIETPETNLLLDLKLNYKNYSAYYEFIDSIEINANIYPSMLYMADLGYFSTVMFDMTNHLNIAGKLHGRVNNFAATDLSVQTGQLTNFNGDIQMRGLPDFYSTYIDLIINNLETSIYDLGRFAIPIESHYLYLPSFLDSLGNPKIEGKFEGYYSDFLAKATIITDVGSVVTDLEMRSDTVSKLVSYKGRLLTNDLDIGKFLGESSGLGNLNMNVQLEGKGLSSQTVDLNLKGKVESLEFLKNTFRDIDLSGDMTKNTFNGKVVINDEKVKLDFLGKVDFSNKFPDFDFSADIHNADLYRLNLLMADTLMQLSSHIEVNFTGLKLNDIEGGVIIDNTIFTDSRGKYSMKHLKLITTNDSLYNRKLTILSDFFDFELGGIADYSKLYGSVRQLVNHYITVGDKPIGKLNIANQDFFFDCILKNTETLSRLFLPELELSSGSNFSGVFTEKDWILNTTFKSNLVSINGIKLNGFEINTKSNSKKATVQLSLGEIIFRKGTSIDTNTLSIERPKIQAILQNDSVLFNLSWKDYLEKSKNRGNISAVFSTDSSNIRQLQITNSDLVINDSTWLINKSNKVVFDQDFTRVNNLELTSGRQVIRLDGRLPFNDADSLDVYFDEWNISNFDPLLRGSGFNIDGIISGDIQFANLVHQPAFFSNLHFKNLTLNDEKLGEARILSSWSNADQSIYVNSQIINIGNVNTSRMLNFSGFYYPMKELDNFNFDISLENFRLKILKPFLVGVVSRIEGLASGEFKLKGTIEKPALSGDLSLTRAGFLIDYLNTFYSVQHDFKITPTEIFIDNAMLYDTLGNKAIARGKISHDYLSNFKFDIDIKANDFLALNTNQQMNDLFYGSAIVTGDVGIKGSINDIGFNIVGTSQKGTNMFIPISMAASVGDKNYVTFVKPKEKIDLEQDKPLIISEDAYDLTLTTYVTPDANLKIFMPYNMGDLAAKGAGTIRLFTNSIGDFTLIGDYVVQSGQFNFVFENLLRKKFDLMEGGRISWTGDPYDAEIDIQGLYRTKTSLSSLGLVRDTTTTIGNRVNVDCIIHLTGQLFEPDIKFSIRLPNSDPQTQQDFFSVIDTTNEALVTQQVISLLVLGSFSNTGASNVSLSSSSINVISNQLSSWLSQISKDFDVGLNYKPGDKLTSNELEVALSTQLFNDRVIIDGNFGVIGNTTSSQAASNIVGDVDIAVKITDDGRWRVKAYNRSNANSSNFVTEYDNYSAYTQGVGILYRKEFDNLKELFQRKKNSPKKNK